ENASSLKIPSDFDGITLAVYEGDKMPDRPDDAVVAACQQITAEIRKPQLPDLVGDWRSQYVMTATPERREITDDVRITASMGGIRITSKQRAADDPYA